jgi:hypothetical protein
MTNTGQEDALARAALIGPTLTGQQHGSAPGTTISACPIVQPMLLERGEDSDRTAVRREGEDARPAHTHGDMGGHGQGSLS